MTYTEFLKHAINDGIAAAQADYSKPQDEQKLAGSLAAFEACRNRTPDKLYELFLMGNEYVNKAFREESEDYWYFKCYHAEVEWICNVVSALLVNEGREPLMAFLPTANGVLKAADILQCCLITKNTNTTIL